MGAIKFSTRNGGYLELWMGICRKCDHVISRINCATPGDLVNAELWAKSVGLEGLKIVDEPNTPEGGLK